MPEAVTLNMIDSIVADAVNRDDLSALPDGLHLLLCGAGSPLTSENRSGPCVAVQAGSSLFIFDAGAGSSRNLGNFFVGVGRIEAVFLTHAHSDHIDGLGELGMRRWVNGGHSQPLPVYGPPVVESVVAGYNEAYAADVEYRVEHHGEDIMPRSGGGMTAMPFELPVEGELKLVLETDEGVKVSAFKVSHEPVSEAVGYRVDYGNRSISISGDTVKSANLIQHSQGVDVMLHEALSSKLISRISEAAKSAGSVRGSKLMKDTLDYHTTPVEAAESAAEAGAGHLVLYHIAPALPVSPLEAIFLSGMAEKFQGEITLGVDGTLVSLPLESGQTAE